MMFHLLKYMPLSSSQRLLQSPLNTPFPSSSAACCSSHCCTRNPREGSPVSFSEDHKMNNLLTDSFERDEKPERERDIELQQIFADMAVLVDAQGEVLDDIENQVQNAVNHVVTGTEALREAKSYRKKSRKCMMIAISILLVIVIIVVLSILKPWAKSK
ncbi:syntaxin-132-like isoform X2 [Miscanthus floridulus]|uniref:syntaxin-132-like isoform X2 n=1 Tax=Miscanthus floridulus TaxID=154761 RepID=UPI003458F123